MPFVHLHTHSEYSILQSSLRIKDMIKKALDDNQPGIALTDHGCMFGILQFYFAAKEMAEKAGKEFNPIIGCDIFLENPLGAKNPKHPEKDHDRLILLCEDNIGYNNLIKIVSYVYEDKERYCNPPIVPLEIVKKHSEGLIAISGNIRSRVAFEILRNKKEDAKQIIKTLQKIFPKKNDEDYFYLDIQDHSLETNDEKNLTKEIIQLSKELSISLLATNDVHYLNSEDQKSHNILQCIQRGLKDHDFVSERFPTNQYHFRTTDEMASLFPEHPEAITNTGDICSRCSVTISKVKDDSFWPKFKFPKEFKNSDDYLSHLTWEALPQRYDKITEDVKKRVQYELDMMKSMKVSGYMLIVQDFINWSREQGIPVGPGRGSAVGSVVSYVIGITDIEPMQFNLLFERFLNPERVSMPDIDTDFSDLDRGKVIDYVSEKYGNKCVSQIVTYGRLKAKAVIRDVGRVLDFEQEDINTIAKLIPIDAKNLTQALESCEELKAEINKNETNRDLWRYSLSLEGLVRQTGIHAAAVIIAPNPMSDLAPLYRADANSNPVIQYDKKYAEDIGLLKMDFLGLRNLSVIDECQKMIEKNHGKKLDLEKISLVDTKTYELFGKGLTVGVFQFESEGMQNYLRQLKPSCLDDMIAMNALYRPGPIENIPTYISRKNSTSDEIDCFHSDLENILGDTYGVIVYQEQVMLLAQQLSGFSLGGADLLRRAMAKKKESEMNKLHPQFINGAIERGYNKELPERIWKVLGPFCEYAFNKSHSAAYAYIGYQTAYLKAHYGPEYMAANMTSEIDSTERLVVLIEECRKMGIEILHPNINSSMATFTATKNSINYGLAGIKNVGSSVIDDLTKERELNGEYTSIFDLCSRVLSYQSDYAKDYKAKYGKIVRKAPLNKKVLESLIMAGALDNIKESNNRATLYASVGISLEYATRAQADKDSGQGSLFDDITTSSKDLKKEPPLDNQEPWSLIEMLDKEKKVLGLYLSNDPLSEFKLEINGFVDSTLNHDDLQSIPTNEDVVLGGRIVEIYARPTKKDPSKIFGILTLQDQNNEKMTCFLSQDLFTEIRDKVDVDSMVMVKGNFQAHKWDSTKPNEFKLKEIISMDEIRSKWSNFIHIRTPNTSNEQLLRNIETIVEEFKLDEQDIKDGFKPCKLVFHYTNSFNNYHIATSKKYKLPCDEEIINEFQNLLGENNVWFSGEINRGF